MKTTIKFILTSFLTLFIFSGYAQEQIPLIEKGAKTSVLSNKKGTEKLNIEILDVIYSDSTRRTCKARIKFQLTAIGGKIPLFKYTDRSASTTCQRLSFDYIDAHGIHSSFSLSNIPFFANLPYLLENQTESFTLDLEVFDNKSFSMQFDDLYLMRLNKYEGGEIIKQREEEIKRKEEEKRRVDNIKLAKKNELYTIGPPIKFDLFPENMIKYIGKVNRAQFEKVVGYPVGLEYGGFIVYRVESTYEERTIDIRCHYRESDGKLISVRFGTLYYLAYWIGFTYLPGYPKTEAEAKRLGAFLPKKDKLGNIHRINFRLKNFGCQIMDIHENQHYTTAIINYHTVK